MSKGNWTSSCIIKNSLWVGFCISVVRFCNFVLLTHFISGKSMQLFFLIIVNYKQTTERRLVFRGQRAEVTTTKKMWKEVEIFFLQKVVVVFISVWTVLHAEKGYHCQRQFLVSCCVPLSTRMSKVLHFATSVNIVYFLSHVYLTYIFMQYFNPWNVRMHSLYVAPFKTNAVVPQPEELSLCSQQPATNPCSEPPKSTSNPPSKSP